MPDEIPVDWYPLARKELQGLEGKMRLLQEADELAVLAGKRGSRRWLPPKADL